MNRVEITGRLTRDPELKFVGARDFPICSLNLAVDDADGRWNAETKKSELGSGFYRVDVTGDYGAELSETLNKGDHVYVVGSLNQYTVGGRDGTEKVSKTQIKAVFVQPLTGKPGSVVPPPTQQPMVDDDEPF